MYESAACKATVASGSEGLPPCSLTQPTVIGLPVAALPAWPPEYSAPSDALIVLAVPLLEAAAVVVEDAPEAPALADDELELPQALTAVAIATSVNPPAIDLRTL